MRLLLDEMYPPALAERLADRGHDVTAVKQDPSLEGLADDALLARAHEDGRAVVTENVRDFVPLAQALAAAGTPHSGIVFVPRNSFPRDRANIEATLGALVTALDALLEEDSDTSGGTWTTWLIR